MSKYSSSPLSSAPSYDIDDPDLIIIKEVSNTPSKMPSVRSCEIGSVQHKAVSGLLSAMKPKPKNAAFSLQTVLRSDAVADLDPFHYTPSFQSVKPSFKGSAYEGDGDDDSDDSNPVPIHRRARRFSSNLGPNRNSQATSTSNTNNVSAGIKRKRESEPAKPMAEYAVYHAEAKRRNIAPKVLFEAERQSLGILVKKPWLHNSGPQVHITGLQYGSPSRSHSFSSPLSQSQLIMEKMSITDRKRFFIYTPTDAMKEAMQIHVSKVYQLFPPTRNISDCMLHPNPRGLLKNGKYNQKIVCNYQWKDASGIHNIGVNFGVVALIVNYRLTAAQKEGFIKEAWHLSHLCGNWICCNWRHHTVEPGPVNCGRNGCFNSSEQCKHDPSCMKEKKVVLNLATSPATPGGNEAAAELSMDIEKDEKRKCQQEQGDAEDAEEIVEVSSGEDSEVEDDDDE